MLTSILPAITVAVIGFQPFEAPEREAGNAQNRAGLVQAQSDLDRSFAEGDTLGAAEIRGDLIQLKNRSSAGPDGRAAVAGGISPDKMHTVRISPTQD